MGQAHRLLLCGSVLASLAAETVSAQPAATEFSVTPYLWIAGVSGTLGTTIPGTASQRVEADFGDVLSHLNGIPVMLAGEVRHGRLGLLGDLMALSVEAGISGQGNAFSAGEARLRQVIGSVLVAWRVVEQGPVALDLGVGFRAFGISTRFTLEPGALPGQQVERDATWVNPIVAFRYRHDLSAGWGATLYGDVGGASGDMTWQAFATIDYRMSERTTLRAGYRWLGFERETGALRQDMGLGGPILGASFRF